MEFLDAKRANLLGLRCSCILCHAEFSKKNVTSEMGWRETQISGICEECFDGMFASWENDHEH